MRDPEALERRRFRVRGVVKGGGLPALRVRGGPVMTAELEALVELSDVESTLVESTLLPARAHPIVLAPRKAALAAPSVTPGSPPGRDEGQA